MLREQVSSWTVLGSRGRTTVHYLKHSHITDYSFYFLSVLVNYKSVELEVHYLPIGQ